ncbi:MAG TPA: hypothetical protein VF575_04040 [Candidatus Saccharimonadales bacterium]|jgi:hypothetical protein
MSKEVDALVIIGHSHLIAQEAPHYNHEDIDQGLWYVRNGKTTWYDGQPITEADKTSLYAGEVFLGLGYLAASHYLQQLPERLQDPNPFREVALDVIEEISPFETGEALRADLAIIWPSMELADSELPKMFDAPLAADSSITDELKEKWDKAQAVHVRRGQVAIMAYGADALLKGLRGLKMDEIALDEVGFDENLNVAIQSYNLAGLVDLAGLQAHLTEIPYYQAFSATTNNGPDMLTSALEDLRLVSTAIS